MYVVSDGVLQRYIYTPFGVSHIQLIDDISGDGSQEIVLSLNWADVPAVCCYDGVTGERLWQCETSQKVYVDDLGWSDLQLGTVDLALADGRENDMVIIGTGRYIFSIDAATGEESWSFRLPDDFVRLVVVDDLDGDGFDEVAAGSRGGRLYLLSGRTGKVRWDTRLAGQYITSHDSTQQAKITSLDVYDSEAGEIIVGGEDGKVSMVDLHNRTVEWVASFLAGIDELPATIRLTSVPDITGDGKPEVLVTLETKTLMSLAALGYMLAQPQSSPVYMLDGGGGEVIWQNELYSWQDSRFQVMLYDGKPVLIESLSGSMVDLVSLSDGSLVRRIALPTLDGKSLHVRQTMDGGFAAVSNRSDLMFVSADGDIQSCYPRTESVSVIAGSFTGTNSHELLVSGSSTLDSTEEETVRAVGMFDRTTR